VKKRFQSLPFKCNLQRYTAENPVDAHYKFHASAALKSALTRANQIAEKAALNAGVAAAAEGVSDEADVGDGMDIDFTASAVAAENGTATAEEAAADPFTLSDALSSRVLIILWANWEDPLSQTVKEVQGAFEQLLDIKNREPNAAANDARGRNKFLLSAAAQLLEKGAHCKGRYVPLSVIVPRLGARNLLELRPQLLDETLTAMRDDSVCCAAGSLIGALSAKLLKEMLDEEREVGGSNPGADSGDGNGNGGGGDVKVAGSSPGVDRPAAAAGKKKRGLLRGQRPRRRRVWAAATTCASAAVGVALWQSGSAGGSLPC
jgi:hypothetical protein